MLEQSKLYCKRRVPSAPINNCIEVCGDCARYTEKWFSRISFCRTHVHERCRLTARNSLVVDRHSSKLQWYMARQLEIVYVNVTTAILYKSSISKSFLYHKKFSFSTTEAIIFYIRNLSLFPSNRWRLQYLKNKSYHMILKKSIFVVIRNSSLQPEQTSS